LNQSEFIEETLRSILLQAYPNFELFVMDAGSTDGTVEILHKYSRWVTFWRSHRDGGQAAAINEGLQLSTGDILCYLNSDDIFCAGAFFSVAREFEVTAYSTPRLFAFEGTIRDTDGRETSVPPSQENYVTPWLSSAHSLFQPACFWNRALWSRQQFVAAYDFCFDKEFFFRAVFLEKCYRFSQAGPVAVFRLHEHSKTATRQDVCLRENIALTQQFVKLPRIRRLLAGERARSGISAVADRSRSENWVYRLFRLSLLAIRQPAALRERMFWGAVRRLFGFRFQRQTS